MYSLKESVYVFLLSIPYGKVVTYGQIAESLGNKNLSRVVGNILHNNPDPKKYPCYKVVNAKGEVSKNFGFGGADAQISLLRKEGIVVENGKVDLSKYQWNNRT